MITLKKYGKTYNMAPLELSGLSTDDKPINNYQTYTIVNGSIFEEIDTGNTYKYDAENDTWKLQPKTAGGADGITPLLKKTDTAIQVSYNNGDSWEDLVLLADITGPAGAKGETGETGPQGPAGAAGADGASITGITLTLTKDGEGAITGGSGTATLSTGGPIEFTVNVSEAGA